MYIQFCGHQHGKHCIWNNLIVWYNIEHVEGAPTIHCQQ